MEDDARTSFQGLGASSFPSSREHISFHDTIGRHDAAQSLHSTEIPSESQRGILSTYNLEYANVFSPAWGGIWTEDSFTNNELSRPVWEVGNAEVNVNSFPVGDSSTSIHQCGPATLQSKEFFSLQQLELHPQNWEQTNAFYWVEPGCIDSANRARIPREHGYGAQELITNHPQPLRKHEPDHRSTAESNSAQRCPRTNGHILRRSSKFITDWYSAHSSSPYPTKDEITALATLSSLSIQQVKVCLSNHRARKKDAANSEPRSAPFAHDVVPSIVDTDFKPSLVQEFLNIDVLGAMEEPYGLRAQGQLTGENLASPAVSQPWLQPEPLLPSAVVSTGEFDHDSSFVSPGHLKSISLKRKGKRQYPSRYNQASRRSPSSSPHQSNDGGIDGSKSFHCTECPESFKNVYSWKRHEAGVHGHNDTEWVCMLHDPRMTGMFCIFCSSFVENVDHYSIHNVQSCLDRHICDRTFARKDLLKQHVQQIHVSNADQLGPAAFQVANTWSQAVPVERISPKALWCGFCLHACGSVAERMKHVAEHFRDGLKMEVWAPYGDM